jgi:hypothetical protein
VIEAFASKRANDALDVSSLPGRPWRRKYLLHAHVPDLLREVVAKDPIAIWQEVARCGVPRQRVTELLDRPLRRRMRGDTEVEDAATVVSQNQEDVENLEAAAESSATLCIP